MDENSANALRRSAQWIEEMEHESWLGTAQLMRDAADDLETRDAEIERLRAAGDALAEMVAVRLPLEGGWPDYVVPYLRAWKEACRG